MPRSVREVLEREFLDAAAARRAGPAPSARWPRATTSACTPQRDGRVFVGFAPRAGRIAGHQLRLVADLADAFGDGPRRGDRAAEARDRAASTPLAPTSLIARLDDLDLRAQPERVPQGHDGVHRHRVLQARDRRDEGPRAVALRRSSTARLPDFDEDMRIHVNGCPNSCARFQVADIGLMSALQPRPDGTKSDAFLVHLGGGDGRGRGASVAR